MPAGQPQGVVEVLEQGWRDVASAAEARRAKVVRGTKGLIVVKNRELAIQN